MALKFSTGLRNFVQNFGSMKQALMNGSVDIFSGTVPVSADDADTGSKLCTITLNSGALTKEVLASGTVTLSGSAGTVTSIVVNSVEVLGQTIAFTTDLTTTAALVASAINSNITSPDYKATSSGAVITISALPGTGTTPNAYDITTTGAGGITAVDVDLSGGIAAVNGLTYGAVASGILSKSGIWSGVNVATGNASYFRIRGSIADAGASSTTLIRIQGTCGLSGADYNMTSLALTQDATHTIGTLTLTLPES